MGSFENLNVDAISNLPADVINNILARLSLRDAVRTSVLSREWRYKWIFIPEIVFDYEFDYELERTVLRNHIERIIDQVLSRHQGPINKFVLEGGPYILPHKTNPDVDHWIFLLSNCKVQDFTLRLKWGKRHVMPAHFFAFQYLRHLTFNRCAFKPPPQFKGFSKLVTLDFYDVVFEPAIFEGFISQCVLLESVRLVECTELDSLEVEGPSLRFFTFRGVFKSIRFKNSPVLAEVSLSTAVQKTREIQFSNCIKYFALLPKLEKLHLHYGLLKFLGTGGVPNRFPDSFNSLIVLDLSMYLDSIEEVASFLCLIRSSPKLQMLRVSLCVERIDGAVTEFLRAQETPDRYLNQLTRVEIEVYAYVEPLMEFARYVLASAARLEKSCSQEEPIKLKTFSINRGRFEAQQQERKLQHNKIHSRKHLFFIVLFLVVNLPSYTLSHP